MKELTKTQFYIVGSNGLGGTCNYGDFYSTEKDCLNAIWFMVFSFRCYGAKINLKLTIEAIKHYAEKHGTAVYRSQEYETIKTIEIKNSQIIKVE